MTTRAGTGLTGNRGMIKSSTQPGGGIMTLITGQSGCYMGRTFTGGDDIVVAVLTGIGGLGMINRI